MIGTTRTRRPSISVTPPPEKAKAKAKAKKESCRIPANSNINSGGGESRTTSPQITNITFVGDKQTAFRFAVKRFQTRQQQSSLNVPHAATVATAATPTPKCLKDLNHNYNDHNDNNNQAGQGQLLNSVRIPKAGSSHLSVQARALAGCQPDGYPCCFVPPSQPLRDFCPRYDLDCPRITGCRDHRPSYQGTEPIISALREPTSRLLSAFFYNGVHRPQPSENHSWYIFKEFLQGNTFRNVLTKMLNEEFAYNIFQPGNHTVGVAKDRLCQMTWYSLSHMPIASTLLLYASGIFRQLLPNPVVFDLPPSVSSSSSSASGKTNLTAWERQHPDAKSSDTLRKNEQQEYMDFKQHIFVEMNGSSLVNMYHQEDLEVYNFALHLFCARLKESGLFEVVRNAEFKNCDEPFLTVKRSQDYCPQQQESIS